MALKPILINTSQTLVRQVFMTDPLFGMGFSGKLRKAASAPVNTSLPTIDNTSPRQGDTITVTPGTWTGADFFSYQWKSGGSDITGETGLAYSVTESVVGTTLTCVETGSNASGDTPAESTQTSVVIPLAPIGSGQPSIISNGDINDPRVGDILAHTYGAWDNNPTSFTEQWFTTPQGSDIPGATGSTYTIQVSDIGWSILVAVTGHNAGGDSTPVNAINSVGIVSP